MTSLFTPRKRRVVRGPCNDENIDPGRVRLEQEDVSNDSEYVLEELEDPFGVSSDEARSTTRPSIREGRVALSSAKLNGLAKSSSISNSMLVESYKRSLLIIEAESPKNIQLLTPSTPRHLDVLSKKIPVTPRHRSIATGKPITPNTPRTPSFPSDAQTIYQSAKQLFIRSTNPGRLVGRDEERSNVSAFLKAATASMSGHCIYISGPPGTGKSALVNEVCSELHGREDVRTAYINCMSVKNPNDIYGKLIEDLCDTIDGERSQMSTLKDLFFTKGDSTGRAYVVTLDEIDHFLTSGLEILYTLFEWSLNPTSTLVLIGIANALDLTDRFLPRLKARNLKPQLLPFLPYTVPQINSVITTKLKTLLPTGTALKDFVPFLHPTAIQFCSKKVASQTGDLRKAFDIVRRSLDLIESETKKKQLEVVFPSPHDSPSKTPLAENPNLSSSSSPSRTFKKPQNPLIQALAHLTPETAPRATIAHVARVTASAFNNGTAQRLKSLNLQQKAALCALVALEKKTAELRTDVLATPSKFSNAAPTIRKVYEMYRGLCQRENALHPLTSTEFADVIGGLETLSLVQGGDGKGVNGLCLGRLTPSKKQKRPEDRRIGSCVSDKEIGGCLEGPGGVILRGLLKGED